MEFWGRERLLRGTLRPVQATMLGLVWGSILFLASYFVSGAMCFSALAVAPLVVAGYVDSVRHLLPDPLLAVAACMVLFGGILDGRLGFESVLAAACGLVVGYAASLVTSLGRGDAKLLGVLGLWLGVDLVLGLLIAVIGAGLWSGFLLLTRRATMATALPLGPWLVGGAICTFIGWPA
ncbi:MAG: prepilin peptidase [Ancrocorticia sp.]|nr:prepilin peptidase [Ancrocorticia sp.]